MSEQVVEPQGPEAIELPTQGDQAFGALMDFLVETDGDEAAGEGGAAADAAAAGDGSNAAGDQGAGAAAAAAGASGAGAAGEPAVAGGAGDAGAAGVTTDSAADGAADQGGAGAGAPALPADWTATVADIQPRFGELSTKLEETTTQAYQDEALTAVRTEYPKYFEALDKHPRLLVGQTVPSATGEGDEVLRDSQDAKEWQEAVKQQLVTEVHDRAQRLLEDNSDFLTTIHASIELFQNNNDLVPGTKEFDRELADRFVALAKPYELRVEEKLQGYSIPVQPIIDSLRSALKAERAAKPAAAAPAAAAPAKPAGAAPQAGITSKAGTSGEDAEDFSTLFGTLGLPGLRI